MNRLISVLSPDQQRPSHIAKIRIVCRRHKSFVTHALDNMERLVNCLDLIEDPLGLV